MGLVGSVPLATALMARSFIDTIEKNDGEVLTVVVGYYAPAIFSLANVAGIVARVHDEIADRDAEVRSLVDNLKAKVEFCTSQLHVIASVTVATRLGETLVYCHSSPSLSGAKVFLCA